MCKKANYLWKIDFTPCLLKSQFRSNMITLITRYILEYKLLTVYTFIYIQSTLLLVNILPYKNHKNMKYKRL